MKAKTYIDQLGRKVGIPVTPVRIVSLVPSQTELLFDLGLDDEVAGITKFCIHPESWFRSKTKIGGTKNPDLNKIRELKPDLVIANKEENLQDHIDTLAQEFPVWVSDVQTLDDACNMILALGEITGRDEAQKIVKQIKSGFDHLKHNISKTIEGQTISVVYLIWHNPYMAAGCDTFINSMLQVCGLKNAVHDFRYPVIDNQKLEELNPRAIFLSSEPYPFRQRHADELKKYVPASKIVFVNGEYFSWYGSRLVHAPFYFEKIIQEVFVKS